MNVFEFLVYRQEGVEIGPVKIVKAEVDGTITNAEKLVDALIVAVTEWVRETEDGKNAYAYAHEGMNIGDLSNYDLQPIIDRSPHIHRLSIEDVDIDRAWTYDTQLCETLDEDGEEC